MTNKTAIITGASRGIGRNVAVNLARRGVCRSAGCVQDRSWAAGRLPALHADL